MPPDSAARSHNGGGAPLPDCYVVLANQQKLPVRLYPIMQSSGYLWTIFLPHLSELLDGEEQIVTAFQDDNSEAMSFLLSFLQGLIASDAIPRVGLVLEVVLLAKKYECTGEIGSLGKSWLAQMIESATDVVAMNECPIPFNDKMNIIISVAYTLDLPEEFSQAAKILIEYSYHDIEHRTDPKHSAPANVFLAIAAKKHKLHSEYTYALNNFMNRFMAKLSIACPNCDNRDEIGANCALTYLSTKSQDYFSNNSRMWKSPTLADRKEIKYYLDCCMDQDLKLLLCNKCYDQVGSQKEGLVEELLETYDRIHSMLDGVCLDCVKGSDIPCRVKHTDCPGGRDNNNSDDSTENNGDDDSNDSNDSTEDNDTNDHNGSGSRGDIHETN